MGDQQHRHPELGAKIADQRQDLRLDRHIQRRRRFVGDQQARPAGQRHGDHDALLHAARQLVRIVIARRAAAAMPTLSISSTARSAASARPRPRCSMSTSAIWKPTLQHRVEAGARLLEDHRRSRPRRARIASAESRKRSTAVEQYPPRRHPALRTQTAPSPPARSPTCPSRFRRRCRRPRPAPTARLTASSTATGPRRPSKATDSPSIAQKIARRAAHRSCIRGRGCRATRRRAG